MGKWCLHASSFIFDWIIIKVAGNQDRHKSLDEFDFGPLVSMAHLYVFVAPLWKSGGYTGFALSFRHSVTLSFCDSVTFEIKMFRHSFLCEA